MCLREMKKTEGTLSLSSTRLHGGGGAAEEDMAEQWTVAVDLTEEGRGNVFVVWSNFFLCLQVHIH